MEKIRLIIVDDHEMVRMGITSYLSTEDDMDIVGEGKHGKEAVALAKQHQPDVVLMDLLMPEMDGIEATRHIKTVSPQSKVIILTSFMDDQQVFPAIEAGAFSYLLKTTRAKDIADAIRLAARGEATLEPAVAKLLMQRLHNKSTPALHDELSEREMEVLLLLGEAKSNQEIADQLFIGIKTVKTHVSNILQKLQLEDRTQAAVYAHKIGLMRERS